MTDYQSITESIRNKFELALDAAIRSLPMHDQLKEAMLYAVDGGGKRLRPVLLLESFALFSKQTEWAMPFAVALEMIHNYSLVHDDLPSMDDDDTRRGRATVHRAYDEGLAVLTGDALLNGAFEIALTAAGEDPHAFQAARILAKAAGTDGMLSGQVMDLYDTVQDVEHLWQLYDKKTGRLIRAACEAGGILGGADSSDLERLGRFAFHLGTAFQIQDDLLDRTQDQEQDNMTILQFMSEEEARENMRIHTQKALEEIQGIHGGDPLRLCKITESLVDRAM